MKDKTKHKYLVGFIGDNQCVYGKDTNSAFSYTHPMTLLQAKRQLKELSGKKTVYELKPVQVQPPQPGEGEVEMIDLNKLTVKDIGRWVFYKRNSERGRIKNWNMKWVFVVYKCDGVWNNYQNYTAAATNPQDLTFIEQSENNNAK